MDFEGITLWKLSQRLLELWKLEEFTASIERGEGWHLWLTAWAKEMSSSSLPACALPLWTLRWGWSQWRITCWLSVCRCNKLFLPGLLEAFQVKVAHTSEHCCHLCTLSLADMDPHPSEYRPENRQESWPEENSNAAVFSQHVQEQKAAPHSALRKSSWHRNPFLLPKYWVIVLPALSRLDASCEFFMLAKFQEP